MLWWFVRVSGWPAASPITVSISSWLCTGGSRGLLRRGRDARCGVEVSEPDVVCGRHDGDSDDDDDDPCMMQTWATLVTQMIPNIPYAAGRPPLAYTVDQGPWRKHQAQAKEGYGYAS